MFRRSLIIFAIITVLLTASCNFLFALSPKASLDPGLVGLAYKHIGFLARAVNDDELLILGEIYKANDLVRENMKHIEPATVDDVTRIVDLFSRIREQDSWGFDPGSREIEEQSFKEMVKGIDINQTSCPLLLVYRQRGKTLGYINISYFTLKDFAEIKIKEIVVDKNHEGKQISKALFYSMLQEIELRLSSKVKAYRLIGVSANEKIYGDTGLAIKTGFERFDNGYENRLIKEIEFSPFTAIRVLQSI